MALLAAAGPVRLGRLAAKGKPHRMTWRGLRRLPCARSTEATLSFARRGRHRYSKPDLVIGDFRLSLSVSARVAGIPYVNVTNAYWSPFARPQFRMPSLPLGRLLSAGLADAAFAIARPIAFAAHALPLNRVRRAFGLPGLGSDVRRVYCDGDLTLYADIPELIPIFSPPIDPPIYRACTLVASGRPSGMVGRGSERRATDLRLVGKLRACATAADGDRSVGTIGTADRGRNGGT